MGTGCIFIGSKNQLNVVKHGDRTQYAQPLTKADILFYVVHFFSKFQLEHVAEAFLSRHGDL